MRIENDLDNRFSYHAPDNEARLSHEELRDKCHDLAKHIEGNVPWGREQALALTKLEEAMFWGNAGIARIDESGERR